jgi:hypothetical protein
MKREGALLHGVTWHILVRDHLGAVRREALDLVRHDAIHRLASKSIHALLEEGRDFRVLLACITNMTKTRSHT